jgi:hypothetical protein
MQRGVAHLFGRIARGFLDLFGNSIDHRLGFLANPCDAVGCTVQRIARQVGRCVYRLSGRLRGLVSSFVVLSIIV